VTIEFITDPDRSTALMSALCEDCMNKGHGELLRVIREDFPGLRITHVFSGEEGHA
jgi:hypothetical protein